MELDSKYAAEVRENLGFFPVWPPGDAVAPGDVGTLRHGVFRREGTLSDLVGEVDLAVTRQPTNQPTRFHSSGCTSGQIHGAGGVPAEAGIDLKAEMTLSFGTEGGVAFDAERCVEEVIGNMLKVRSAIEARRHAWKAGYVLVSRVTVAERYTVVVSGRAGASVSVQGAADALKQWNIAKAGVSGGQSNQGGYERSGDGPILLGLYGFDWMFNLGGGSLIPLSLEKAAPSDATFIELPARSPAFDPT